jgi:hypothetical protein
MSDMRDPEPAERVFEIKTRGNQRYEAELAAWPYHGCRSDKVLSRKLIYRFNADNFDHARQILDLAYQTVAAVHDIWQTKIVSIQELDR